MSLSKFALLSVVAVASAQIVTQISDGQIQVPKATSSSSARLVTQISDGQVQAPKATTSSVARVVTQISDGQIQVTASTSRATTSSASAIKATSSLTSSSSSKATASSSAATSKASASSSTSPSKAASSSSSSVPTSKATGSSSASVSKATVSSASIATSKAAASSAVPASAPYQHVALFSVDGMHASDLTKYIADRPNSTFASLLKTAYNYGDAYTTGPSDSFPGCTAQYTGAGPADSGIYYDVTYDRAYWAAGTNCSGAPGAQTAYDETIDYNSTELFSGGIDPSNLAETLVNGKCTPIYPHQRLNVNTIMEVARAHGLETAYTDKHPAYDILRGPSGNGLTTGYFPEQAAVGSTIDDNIAYDQYHVNAFLDWLDVITPAYSEGNLTKVPSIYVNVAEKNTTIGGYLNQTGFPFNTGMLQALDFIDASLGDVVAKLKAKSLYNNTLIIVASKHGQAPINRTLFTPIDPQTIVNLTGVPVSFFQGDDIGLLYLNNSADLAQATANLNTTAARKAGNILSLISGANFTASGFGAVAPGNSRAPDIIIQPTLGTVYTTSKAKISEHGGLSDDDRHVTCFAANPNLKAMTFAGRVNTTQIAPTVLKALGLNPNELMAVNKTGVQVLPGF